MNRIVTFIIAAAMTLGSYAARAAGDAKAAELLAQARAAIGGEKQIATVKGLACAGTVQRSIGDRQVSGELTIDLQMPDKIVRADSISPMGDSALVVTEQGLNGDILIRSSRVINGPPGMVIRMPPPPAPGSDAEAQAIRNTRAEFARFVVAMLLTPPSVLPVEFSYAGEAESPDGKADVLDMQGEASFAGKLFLDKTSHRPLMIAYRGAVPRMVMQTQRGPAPPPGSPSHAEPAAPPPPDIVDINLFFDDYKPVDGIQLPHHISRAVGGQTNEEWTFRSIKVNPAFKPETFRAR